MAWEARHGGAYYYRAVREGGRVAKRYFGRGPVAELAASLDAEARARRRAEAGAIRDERARLAPLDAAMAALDSACRAMLAAELMAAGFRRHDRGEWRRRRVRE